MQLDVVVEGAGAAMCAVGSDFGFVFSDVLGGQAEGAPMRIGIAVADGLHEVDVVQPREAAVAEYAVDVFEQEGQVAAELIEVAFRVQAVFHFASHARRRRFFFLLPFFLRAFFDEFTRFRPRRGVTRAV